MKRPLLLFIVLLYSFFSITNADAQCSLEANSIVCLYEKLDVSFTSEETYSFVTVNAFNQTGSMNIPALIQNQTDASAEVIFLEEGNAELVIRYYHEGAIVDICNQNVIVFGDEPIPLLGMVSDFLGDQIACEEIDIDFNIFLNCPDCIQSWTINGAEVDLPQEIFSIGNNQSITTNLSIDSLGEYTLCQTVLKADATCFVEDCVQISIVEIEVTPSFEIIDEQEITYCLGSEIGFDNTSDIPEDVTYHWSISYDSLTWNYYTEDLDFTFDLPGMYTVNLEYTLTNNPRCISPQSSMVINIFDAPTLLISCDGQLCFQNEISYRSPINCTDYDWIVDPNYGSIINQEASSITVLWNEVTDYIETKIILLMNDCEQDVCHQLSRSITLFPSQISINGPKDLCANGNFMYTADMIPGASYDWNIEITNQISGITPTFTSNQENIINLQISSFVGEFNLTTTASIEDSGCQVSTSQTIRRFNFIHDDNLCKEDLFKSELFPKIDEDVLWTVTNADGSFFKQEIESGLDNFLAFGFPAGGTYSVTAAIPALDFMCESALSFQVIDSPEVMLSGPLNICEGEEYQYTLSDLGANDVVSWEIFQNGMFSNITAQEINVTWLEGGAPYLIRVTRRTESSIGQVCESDDFLFSIEITDPVFATITGPEVVCYDAISSYETDISGDCIWSITPPYMGTIVEGDSTENITVQWHYAPSIESATLSYTTNYCGESIVAELEVAFAPFQPIMNLPDSVCQDTRVEIKVENLLNYDIIEYYINGELLADNRSGYSHIFNEIGLNLIRIKILNPNDCPGLTDITIPIYVEPTPIFDFDFTMDLMQCPVDSFETVVVKPSILNDQYYYQWELDGMTTKEGFGNAEIYTFLITKDMILANSNLKLTITAPNSCSSSEIILLDYDCDKLIPLCICKEEVIGTIDYITKHECNLISFGGSLDFSTIVSAEWVIPQGDSLTYIPINSEADLTQDSIYLSKNRLAAIITMRVICDGQVTNEDGSIENTTCEFIFIEEQFPLLSPSARTDYVCNANLNYDVIIDITSHPFYPAGSLTTEWIINDITYTDESIELIDFPPNTNIEITITQCLLDGSYCCTKDLLFISPQPFNPQITLPNGSCENDLWLFTVDISPFTIQSILWDFGDGSGSTLAISEKGYDTTDEQTINVVVTNDRGCTAYDTIVVESFENLINGEIEFTSAPCDPEAPMDYIENSDSEIVSYEWSLFGASDTSSILVTESGDYTVIVTDNHGCTAESIIEDIIINESFSGGIFAQKAYCGQGRAYISQNDLFSYTWFVDGDSITTGNSLLISEAGQFDIMVISTQISTNSVCDSISTEISIYANPDLPNITIDKTYCDPLIAELSVNNYPEVNWIGVGINETSKIFLTSSAGLYNASYTDENGCTSTSPLNIEDSQVDFDYLADICIQTCREDLDSLQFVIPGNGSFFDAWSWSSIDSNGMEYTVSTSSGSIPSLLITDEMYDYLELTVDIDECNYSSGLIPLDIIQCSMEEEEILCDTIGIFSANCGHDIYKCVVSEENGGPKYYYEGHITTTMQAHLCMDSLYATISSGHIDILNYETITNPDSTLHIDYSANIFIDNVQEFEDSTTYIRFEFCDAMDMQTSCIEYILPYRSCTVDFECLIDCVGIYYGTDEYVNVTYCLNLSDVVQDDCTLETYYMTLAITNDTDAKIIYEEVISADYNQLYCLDIPISIEDFTSGEFECLEMYVVGDCPDILCYDYQCGAFAPQNLADDSSISTRSSSARQPLNLLPSKNPELKIYPNPTKGKLTISYPDVQFGDRYIIKTILGNIAHSGYFRSENISVNLSDQSNGLYFVSIVRNGEVIDSRKVFLVE